MKTDFRMNWWALPMLPFALVAALVAGLFSKPRRLSAGKMVEELEALIAFAEGAGEWDSDEFESVPLVDPVLEGLRRRALRADWPKPNADALRAVLIDVQRIAAEERAG